MPPIRVLPEAIVNKIAAGEVVERPASVVKELLENALDAGAGTVEITVQHGGKRLIQVADDGCGMSREDAALAIQRHATSKITDLDDLLRVASFGFRGEALPSIAAVSRLTIVTAEPGATVGTELVVEGGRQEVVRDAPPRRGTTIEVRDLFFNTPARRKFLRTDPTELGHIHDTVVNLAFAYRTVHIVLKADGTVLLDAPPCATLHERAQALWGADVARDLLELEGTTPGVRITGLIGTPAQARPTRAWQSFFVNRRWVRAPGFSFALQEAYAGRLPHGRYPVAVCCLEVDPTRVDVNVHPTKREVRIANEQALKAKLCTLAAERLTLAPDLAPRLGSTTSTPLTLSPPRAASRGGVEGSTEAPPATGPPPSLFAVREHPATATATATLQAPIAIRNGLEVTKILGQLHGTFIVAETVGGWVLVDQHAAHERVQFEALLQNLRAARPERQPLLIEEVLDLSPRHHAAFVEALPFLERVGFELEPFGERAFLIRAVPAQLGEEDPKRFLQEFAEMLEDRALRTRIEDHQDALAALIACKRQSVKAHDRLTPQAMQALLARLAQCENPFSCPHGRPTLIRQSLADLERQFKRS